MYKRYVNSLKMATKKSSKQNLSDADLKIVMFLGTVREGRVGIRVARFMQRELEAKNIEVTLFDPMEMQFDLLKKPLFHYKNKEEAPQWLRDAETKVKAADAYVIISAEYNHCLPPALTNMMDHFGGSCYSYKPSGLVTYSGGQYGGMRAAMQLRALTGELGCLSVSNIFGVPNAYQAFNEAGEPQNDHMKSGAEKLIKQLTWMAHAMKNHRDKFGLPQ